jgi:hypothetical protein
VVKKNMDSSSRIGFDTCKVLFDCQSVDELDYAIGIVNNFYRIYREQLMVLDEIRGYRKLGLRVGLVELK